VNRTDAPCHRLKNMETWAAGFNVVVDASVIV
jgi:hypothetical protein